MMMTWQEEKPLSVLCSPRVEHIAMVTPRPRDEELESSRVGHVHAACSHTMSRTAVVSAARHVESDSTKRAPPAWLRV
ncbi:hypothetical protein EXIGLDRAFT_201100 [Exidia glandulosa HHB12029]|uniref:Uncharacterized protein n=1 Tax=Exidia glandulosa HHB12029 TaxID=1314781 RepID=A0A165EQX5_EXIGL|nr:hypothetical protein EXIGLDRAFT_201100 [Exidia glandulosa HHB12029]